MTHWTETFFVERPELFLPSLTSLEPEAGGEARALLDRIGETFYHTPKTVLDVGCGIGRHVVAFADLGRDVDGFDISPTYLGEAASRVEAAGVTDQVDLFEADMRAMEADELDAEYDLVVNLFNTFGYFDDETNLTVLKNFRDHLAPDGVLALQVSNRDAVVYDFDESGFHQREDRASARQCFFDVETSTLTVTRDVFDRDGDSLDHVGRVDYELRLYSVPELKRLCREAGFEEVHVFGGYDGTKLSLETEQLLVLAR